MLVLVRFIILVTVDVLLELSHKITDPPFDAEDNDAGLLLACWYSECDWLVAPLLLCFSAHTYRMFFAACLA